MLRSMLSTLLLVAAQALVPAAPDAGSAPADGEGWPLALDLAGDRARQTLVDREAGQYLGHPTTVLLEDGRTILCVYPRGHGRGPVALKRSRDGGRTWSERLPVPDSWASSKETPTVHRVVDRDGTRRLILFSGLFPIRMSVSEDDGESWSELAPIGPPDAPFGGIVAMASVEALRDAEGRPDGRYLALFHDDGRFIEGGGQAGTFRVYGSRSEDGGLTWGAPEVIATHPEAQLCEPGLVRSPDGRRLLVLLRENSRRFESFAITSDDEGRTWSEPRPVHPALTGDRHVARYAPDGRLLITFRDMAHGSATRGDWVAWVGRFEDLVDREGGQYRVRLMDNRNAWDCAYPGLELLPDGTFVTTTYGHWIEGEPPFIVSVRLSLDELDRLAADTGRAGGAERPAEADEAPLDPLDQWGQWRGPLATGVAPRADPPLRWSETENVRWKVPLAGMGQGTPLVWGERVYLTAAIPTEPLESPIPDTSKDGHDNAPITHRQAFVVQALDRADGERLWETRVREDLPHQGVHVTGTFASGSPVTDGERLYASFGSRGVYALDLEGGVRWAVDLGDMNVKHGHGESSTPALFEDTLVVNWDHEGPSFVVALNADTGEERWRSDRDEVTSWAAPLALEHDGVPQVIVPGSKRIRSYRLEDGEVLWECGGMSQNIVATPVAGDGLVFVGSSYELRRLLAIRLGGSGDLTGSDHVVWGRTQGTPYVPSPLLIGDSLYVLRHYQNVLTRLGAADGAERPGAFRLEGLANIYASPVAVPASGERPARVYVTDLQGSTLVLEDANPPVALGLNRLDDVFAASAAVAGDQLFLRGERFLYCLAED